jgi:hypothetical protein
MQRTGVFDSESLNRPHFVEICFSDPAPANDTPYSLRGEDQRSEPRWRVLLSALVVRRDFAMSYRCGIRDVSPRGARLKAPPGVLIPNDFYLIDIRDGMGFEAHTCWRHYPQVGVSVGNGMSLKDPTSLLARRLRALWTPVSS